MLAPGDRLGVYEILGPLGAGGMGEVYRARDARLKRDVALKVLPAPFTTDPDRLARFQREAEVLASLNHPNIAHIHGFEESGPLRALVLELVEGPTLMDRLAEGPLPVDEAMAVARQIADALLAAHEQGIIHRDLKPANVKLRPDGTVKVLDFGLAKALEPAPAADPGVSPTITSPAMTQAGMLLGTAAYMSPEQARGRPADKRSDVWAFGCVLYEMLSGRRAFEGEDVSDTLALILRGEPDWSALPPAVPPAIRTLIRRCLERDRRRRIGDLSAALFVLDDGGSLSGAAPASVIAAPPGRRTASRLWTLAAVAAVAAALAAAAAWSLRPRPAAPTPVRFAIPVPSSPIVVGRQVVAISRDGTQVAFVVNGALYVKSIADFEARQLPEPVRGTNSVAFSPDGRSLAFHSRDDEAIKRIALDGSTSVTVCATDPPLGLRWEDSGIVFGLGGQGIFRCAPSGGAPEPFVTHAEGEGVQGPQVLDDGTVLFALASAGTGPARWDNARIVAQRPSGERRTVLEGGSQPRYVRSGHLLYTRTGVVLAVPFDVSRLEAIGPPAPVVEGVRRSDLLGGADYDVSDTGTLAYVPGPIYSASSATALAVSDRSGTLTRLPLRPGPYVHVRASRDGRQLAIGSDDGQEAIVWVYDLGDPGAAGQRLTFNGQNRFPIWSPDGRHVTFQSSRDGDAGLFRQPADGGREAERLTRSEAGESHVPEAWSPDGRHLLFTRRRGDAEHSLWIRSAADGTIAPVGDVQSREPIGAVFSRDGRWFAYALTPFRGSRRSTDRGVFVQPFPPTGARYQAPNIEFDFHPVWSAEGLELFYVPSAQARELAAVPVIATPTLRFGSVSKIPAVMTANRISLEPRAFDVLPGRGFVGIARPETGDRQPGGASEIRVVMNWFEELSRRAPPR